MSWLSAWADKVLLTDLPENRRWSYLYFSGALLVTLASHTFVGNVKTSVFLDLVGTAQEPIAKSCVMAVLFPVTFFYSIAVSCVRSPRHLVTGVCVLYSVAFALIAAGLGAHRRSAVFEAWAMYYAVETSGVIVMPMIWSVVADVTPADLATKAFPAIFFAIQVGGILGSLVSINVGSLGGEVGLLVLQVVCFVLIAVLAQRACVLADDPDGENRPLLPDQRVPDSERGASAAVPEQKATEGQVAAAAEPEPGPEQSFLVRQLSQGMHGLWLLVSRPYVFGIFFVSYASLVPRTVLDYQNSVLAVDAFSTRQEQIAYFGRLNLWINLGSAALTLVGTRPIVEFFGVGNTLMVLPVGLAVAVFALCAKHTVAMSTFSLVLACVLAYGLNSPCKEMLYVRTSKDIKYKAKSWSEWYGNQLMKLLGSQINLWVNRETVSCGSHCFNSHATGYIAGAWALLWLVVAFTMGRHHTALEADNKIVT